MMHKAWNSIEEVPYCFLGHPSNFKITRDKNNRFWRKFGISGLSLQFEFTDGYEMMHKAWSSIEEVPCSFLAVTKQLYEWYFLSVWRNMVWLKGLRASPKIYYGNTTPSIASIHHWRNVKETSLDHNQTGPQDLTRTSQKNDDQYSRNFGTS